VSGTSEPGRPAGLWRNGDFLRLWAAQSVSLVGTQVTALALPLAAILKLNASPFQVGLLVTFQYLPYLIVSLPAGAIVDRLRHLPVLVRSDLIRALLLIAVPISAWTGWLSLGLLYPVALLVGTFSVLADVTSQSFLPSLVKPNQLIDANGKLQLSYSAAQLAGPGLGGVLVQALTAPVAIAVDVASYLCSAGLQATIRHGREAAQPTKPRPARTDLRALGRDIGEGVRYVWRHRLIRPLALATGISNFFYLFGMTGAVFTLYAVRQLGLTPGLLGLVLALGNVGAIAGTLAAPRILARWRFGYIMIAGSVVSAVAVAIMALATRGGAVPALAAAVIVGELGICVYNLAQLSLRQAVTPTELLGRMNATVRFLNWGPIPLGALVGGSLGQTIGLRPTLWVAAAGSVLPAIPLLLSQIRSLRDLPTEPVPIIGAQPGSAADPASPTATHSTPAVFTDE
jgi:MFS family permease